MHKLLLCILNSIADANKIQFFTNKHDQFLRVSKSYLKKLNISLVSSTIQGTKIIDEFCCAPYLPELVQVTTESKFRVQQAPDQSVNTTELLDIKLLLAISQAGYPIQKAFPAINLFMVSQKVQILPNSPFYAILERAKFPPEHTLCLLAIYSELRRR